MNESAPRPETSSGIATPMAVGRYRHRDGEIRLLPYSFPEMQRAILACQMRIGTCHFRTGDQLLLTSLYDESAQFAPLERALRDFGMVLLSADASFFDARRTESILRRFAVAAVAGVNAALLDGLEAIGHDPLQLLSGRVVWARPDAHARLATSAGIRLRLWAEVGPAVAMQCARGEGAHVDRLEWHVDEVDGEVVLSSRLDRCMDFHRYRTGLRARVDHSGCPCGSADPRIVL